MHAVTWLQQAPPLACGARVACDAETCTRGQKHQPTTTRQHTRRIPAAVTCIDQEGLLAAGRRELRRQCVEPLVRVWRRLGRAVGQILLQTPRDVIMHVGHG